jgi:tetratricopeptide (TPR) repeat protein
MLILSVKLQHISIVCLMRKLFVCYVLLLLAPVMAASSAGSLPSTEEGLLDLLDRELIRRDGYIRKRIASADSLNKLIASQSERRTELYLDLGTMVAPINCDSAISVFNRGLEVARNVGDSVSAQRFLILSASELRKFGATPDALNALKNVNENGIFPENRLLYYETVRDLNLYIAEILESSEVARSYLKEGMNFAEKQLELLPPDTPSAQIAQSIIYYAKGQRPLSAGSLHNLATDLDMSDPDFSLAMTMLGGQYYYLGSLHEAVRYWSLAAISEVRNGDLKGSAMARLGRALYDLGDLERAYKYLSISLENSVRAGDMSNTVFVSESMIPVSQALSSLSHRRMLMMFGLIVTLSVVILLLGNFYRHRKRRVKELEQVKRQLANANMIKEAYISEFINLCSSYMGSLEDFTRMCRRKITAGQTDDLLKYMKEGRFMDEQREKFDEIFDETFLAIYPGFITGLNHLLLPDKQIVLSSPNVLSTELRVLAFMRLGVDDTARIAHFLGVSTNTIYTYRNKFRNMAVERETFDSDVMQIGAMK